MTALPPPAPGRAFRFAVDRGGTFTDVYCTYATDAAAGTAELVIKLLSEDPANYPDAPREGIRRALERATGRPHPRATPLDTSRIASIRMGTTVATNALLERKGERCALVTTAGFRDLLHIGTQARPAIFDLTAARPGVLHEAVVEVDELVTLPLGDRPSRRAGPTPAQDEADWPPGGRLVRVATGETVCVRRAPDLDRVKRDLQGLLDSGVTSVAVVFKHAALFPDHERAVGAAAAALGFRHVALSHACAAAVRMVPRGYTADADAYLTPHIARYLAGFQAGFDAGLANVDVAFMQSDGALARADRFSGFRAILSGPAGGYVGYARTTAWDGGEEGGADTTTTTTALHRPPQIIGFDMGGTSTDVSRYAGAHELVHECTTAGVTVAAPQLDINTVAAGGGSRLFFRHGMLAVGPESAGAHPGPCCYRKGGFAAVTDANVVLGRVQPSFFPAIFGPDEASPLDADASAAGLAALLTAVNAAAAADGRPPLDLDGLALGFVDVANEAMCRPIRALTQAKGYDVADHALAVFGGAGAQHACAVAAALGMHTVFVHRHAGVLSAVGIALADVAVEAREPAAADAADGGALAALGARLDALAAAATRDLQAQGFAAADVAVSRFLNVRYDGTDVPVMVAVAGGDGDDKAGAATLDPPSILAAFEAAYRREFGFVLEARGLIVDDVRVRAVGGSGARGGADAEPAGPLALPPPAAVVGAAFAVGGRQPTPVFRLEGLAPGQAVPGPALIVADTCTIVVEPRCAATVTRGRSLRIDVGGAGAPPAATIPATLADADPVKLALFSHRFMGIAEQMGRVLQRTAVSVNIKERLDFSCALFGGDGGLVANAPHLPVHLGAMSEAVKYQIKHWSPTGPGAADPLAPGDVVLTNHPQLAGGSHLPDITVITPVFIDGSPSPAFFVASRGHHADVGGVTPGSMPPTSTCLADEGAAIVGAKLVTKGVFQEDAVAALLTHPPATPGAPTAPIGTRCLADNISDLRAQAAANARGIALVSALVEEAGAGMVLAYMAHIQANAEASVRAMLKKFAGERVGKGSGGPGKSAGRSVVVTAADQMDDGTPIALTVTIDAATGDATFDFGGTGPQVIGNTNAPPAVTASAVVYALRCMVASDIPLNQGCLAPVTIVLPRGSLLAPRADAAVVGGNVLTSQRVTDVVLKAFGAAAASQGCMNNFTFGDGAFGYYETIAGGGGAGPAWVGADGVHTHMTNTRITDPEVLERRYPVVLHAFSLRRGSGGAGARRGGDGVVRDVEFLRPVTACVLTERRATRPFGLAGGGAGAAGVNLLVRRGGDVVSLGGKAVVAVGGGDRVVIHTPGGGGYGAPGAEVVADAAPSPVPLPRAAGSVHAYKAAQESA